MLLVRPNTKCSFAGRAAGVFAASKIAAFGFRTILWFVPAAIRSRV